MNEKCAQCWKETSLCLCEEIQSLPTTTKLLILQHPQEARNRLGTARLTSLSIQNAVHKVGFSWKSLSHALGGIANPTEWAVLYLGTLKDAPKLIIDKPVQILDKKNLLVSLKSIKGIVLLDGNWKQSKTLWWRNSWLLKLNRVVLNPTSQSMYGEIRKQPRKNCLSTIEAAAETFSALGENPQLAVNLKKTFASHLARLQ